MFNDYITEKLLRLKKRLVIYFLKSRVKSGTIKYPTTQDVFQASINMLTELGEGHIVYFRMKRRDWWAILEWYKMSVELSEANYFIRIKLPHDNSPKRVFEGDAFRISDDYTIEKLGRRWATFSVKKAHKETIAPFLQSIYERFYAKFVDYDLIGDVTLSVEGGD